MPAGNSAAHSSFRCRLALIVLAATVIMAPAPARAGDDARLPGRIYVVDNAVGDVLHGLLAIDPNERTVMAIENSIRYVARVGPGARKVAYNDLDRNSRSFLPYVLDLDQNQGAVRVDERMGLLTWSGDGKELVFSLLQRDNDPGQPRSWRMKADGSKRQPLALPPTEHIWDWSTDGQWLVASSSRRGGADHPPPALQALPLVVERIDGSDATEIVLAGVVARPEAEGHTTVTLNPRFSPDGRSVCYIRLTYEGPPTPATKFTSALWIVGRDGTNRRRLFEGTDDDGYPRSAAWSPDGNALALGLVKPQGERRDGAGTIARLLVINTKPAAVREVPLPAISRIQVADWR